MKVRASLIALLAVWGLGVCTAAAQPATLSSQPASPAAGYKLDPEFNTSSPDGSIAIEQYVNKETDDYKWQFWMRRQGTFARLDPEAAGYPADFLFTDDLKRIVREQKTGSGEATLYLYRLASRGGVRTSRQPLGDRAWAFLRSRPDWRKIAKKPEYHQSASLLDGFEKNYRSLGVRWPAQRYLLITLSADADIKGRKPMQTSVLHGWRCRYDLQTGRFDVPAVFSSHNAKALVPKSPGDL